MTESTLNIAYEDLRKFAGERLGYGRGVDLAWTSRQGDQIKETLDSAVRQVYFPPPLPDERVPHSWRDLRPIAQIVISSGLSSTLLQAPTVSAAKTRIVVGPGSGIFQPEMAIGPDGVTPDEVYFTASGNAYKIIEYLSAESVKVEGDATGEGTAFKVRRLGSMLEEPTSIVAGGIVVYVDPSLDFWKQYMSAAPNNWTIEFAEDDADPKSGYHVAGVNTSLQFANVAFLDFPPTPQAWIFNGHEFYVYSPVQTVLASTTQLQTTNVLLATDALTKSNEGETLTIGDTDYTIAGVIAANQCIVNGDASGHAAGTAVTTTRDGVADYDLPDDFGGLQGPVTMVEDRPTFGPIVLTGEGVIRQLRQSTTERTGRPRQVAIKTKTFDAQTAPRYQIMVYPKPDGTYTLSLPYYTRPDAIDGKHRFSRLGMEHIELLKQSILAIIEQIDEEVKGTQWDRFMERLTASVFADRLRHEPETLGKMTDRPWTARVGDRVIHPGLTVTYGGPL